MSDSWFGSSADLCCYVGIPAVRAAIDEFCYVQSVTNRNIVWDSITCIRSSDESLMNLLVFTWRFLNHVMGIDVANSLPAHFF